MVFDVEGCYGWGPSTENLSVLMFDDGTIIS